MRGSFWRAISRAWGRRINTRSRRCDRISSRGSPSCRSGVTDGRFIVNPGSVGLQAYQRLHPTVHAIETGSPHARYAIVTQQADGWTAEFRAVEYAWDEAAALAEQRGRADWAVALRTGRVAT